MNRQKSFQNENGPAVYLVPTPIGNLSEISPRQKEALENADVIACEDTRNSGLLLKSIGIHKPLIAHHEYNAHTSSTGILKLLEEGKKVAVISDAGYPLISDPGSELVRLASQAGYPVIPVSGSNAALNALVASGLETSHFLFYGFLDAKSVRRKKELESLKSLPYTVIFYEAPHRIEKMLEDVKEVFGDRQICLARELTKLHEEFLRGTISKILPLVSQLKGEMVVVVQGCPQQTDRSFEETVRMASELAASGIKPKQAAAKASEESGFSKNEVYQEMMRQKKEQEEQ
ncbi:16S rRNA (cytidine(1402)-2'-O)-methyltransferase [uncultured Allobaculum sp.]|uniref:16S rRNA (cytidine(1402)-2'-O)-methyltransferase n=1 Tax=uncultured Allobaculum sp. TaxID=1187017 RepID=UPI0025874B3C|nr:16S rRNA (cytidine(1402)-2'-O)-methyltransferase [uncultured Allobaculum sp.]